VTRARAAAVAGLAALLSGCPHGTGGMPSGDGPLVGVYKAIVSGEGAPRRSATIHLWAALPDRLHAEVVTPVGSVTLTLDAGGGRVCLVDVSEGTAYAGEDDAGALAAIAGVPLTAGDAVRALLAGVAPAGYTVTRDGGSDPGLPEHLRIEGGARSAQLTRVRLVRLGTSEAALGTGDPPGRLAVRPLADFTGGQAR
jgi:hypothetical protein